MVEAFVGGFFSSDELDNLHVRVCCALDVLLHLRDGELSFLEVVWLKPLAVEPFEGVIGECGSECCFLLLFFDCRCRDGVYVRRDEEVFPFQFPSFEIVSVFLQVELGGFAVVFGTTVVASGEFLGEFLLLVELCLESSLPIVAGLLEFRLHLVFFLIALSLGFIFLLLALSLGFVPFQVMLALHLSDLLCRLRLHVLHLFDQHGHCRFHAGDDGDVCWRGLFLHVRVVPPVVGGDVVGGDVSVFVVGHLWFRFRFVRFIFH